MQDDRILQTLYQESTTVSKGLSLLVSESSRRCKQTRLNNYKEQVTAYTRGNTLHECTDMKVDTQHKAT